MTKTLRNIVSATAVAAILLALAPLAVQAGGDNLYVSGEIAIPISGTAGTNSITLDNYKGIQWGDIAGFRIYNAGITSGYVSVTCEDLAKPVTLFASDATTNLTLHIIQTNGWSCVGTNLFARDVKIVVTTDGAVTNSIQNWQWELYCK